MPFVVAFIPLLFFLFGTLIGTTAGVTAGDVDLVRALECASNAACYAVHPSSIADIDLSKSSGPIVKTSNSPDPHGDTKVGYYNYFVPVLQENLGLNSDFTPKTGSTLREHPDFVFVIYNGTNTWGQSVCRKYRYVGGILQETDLGGVTGSFPQTFSVNEISLDIYAGAGGNRSYTLTKPGSVAVIKGKVKQIGKTTDMTFVRAISEEFKTTKDWGTPNTPFNRL
ncbi:MAG: hypothetical protein GX295_11690 [Syntrophomonadaceae bacterium]|nr:hypothetical protein [Syntrophomonadaceae bacterium]